MLAGLPAPDWSGQYRRPGPGVVSTPESRCITSGAVAFAFAGRWCWPRATPDGGAADTLNQDGSADGSVRSGSVVRAPTGPQPGDDVGGSRLYTVSVTSEYEFGLHRCANRPTYPAPCPRPSSTSMMSIMSAPLTNHWNRFPRTTRRHGKSPPAITYADPTYPLLGTAVPAKADAFVGRIMSTPPRRRRTEMQLSCGGGCRCAGVGEQSGEVGVRRSVGVGFGDAAGRGATRERARECGIVTWRDATARHEGTRASPRLPSAACAALTSLLVIAR